MTLLGTRGVPSIQSLKQTLFDAYGGFADKRIKKLDKASIFIVDDRNPGGLASDGSFFGWFCSVTANVKDATTVTVTLGNTIPVGAAVLQWERSNGAARTKNWNRDHLSFDVTPADVGKLITLGDAFLSIVRPGAPRYPEPSYKYSCPRTAHALRRLHDVLDAYWRNPPP